MMHATEWLDLIENVSSDVKFQLRPLHHDDARFRHPGQVAIRSVRANLSPLQELAILLRPQTRTFTLSELAKAFEGADLREIEAIEAASDHSIKFLVANGYWQHLYIRVALLRIFHLTEV